MEVCVFVVRTTVEIFEIKVTGRSAITRSFLSKLSISEYSGSIGICIKKGEKSKLYIYFR